MVEMGENKIKELVLKLDLGGRVTVEVGRAMLPLSPASVPISAHTCPSCLVLLPGQSWLQDKDLRA